METYLAQPSGRIGAVDALRGFDMFWITGGTYLVREVCHWIGWPALDPILRHIRHSAWNGCTAYDVIFPLFLFIVGVSMTFSITRRLERGENRATLLRHIVRRTLTIFILGLVYNFTTHYDPSAIRIMGVLQRIALCYGLASLVVLYTPVAGQWAIGAGLLVGYWLLMTRVPVPGVGAGVLTPEGNLAGWLDRQLLPGAFAGYGFGDNEGLLSTLPAIVNTLAGVQAGHWLRGRAPGNRKALGLAAAGMASLAVGWAWGLVFPINKLIWSSSYVVWTVGWSLLALALFYYLIDVRGWSRWSWPFMIIGMNALTIYFVQHVTHFRAFVQWALKMPGQWLGAFGPVFVAAAFVALSWLFLYLLWRRRIFLKV